MQWLKNLFGAGKSEPEQKNTVTVRREVGDLYVFRITGTLNKPTADRIQGIARQEIVRGTTDLKLLVILDGFKGWRKGDDWGDLNFFTQYGDDIAKIAVVGELQWKEKVLIFLLAGRRRGEVRYFESGTELIARAWLNESQK